MDTAIKLAICIIIFFAGFTIGQGHGLFDYNGDGKVNQADLHDFTDGIFKKS